MNATAHVSIAASALACALVIAGCQREAAAPAAAPATNASSAATAHSGLAINEWALPTVDGAAQPDLAVGPDGRLLLSWIRKLGDRNALVYATYLGDDTWESAPKTIVVGRTLSANWANTPHILMTEDGGLWAHWLQTPANAASPHASDVVLTRSPDNGVHWSAPVAVNDDGTGTEHGFASLWPAGADTLGIAWLDGRNTAGAGHMHGTEATKPGKTAHAGHDDHAGEMTVRGAMFDATMKRTDDVQIDASTCDCCGTDVAATPRGALLVYRDRTEDEIRDIVAIRRGAKAWGKPVVVHADGWKMPACPLNGPAVAANGNNVAVAWYTAPDEKASVRLARSADAGDHFDAPLEIDAGPAVQGRVDVAMDDTATWVAWLREDARGQSLQLARFGVGGGKPQQVEVARLQGRGRGTGFPRLAVRRGIAFVVWTDIVEGRTRLAGAKVAPAH